MGDREIELKLLADEPAMRRLRRQPWLKEMQRGHAVTRALRSVYFDTPDLRLTEARAALRIRTVGRNRIQTLKTAGTALGGGAFDRGEWESPVSGDIPERTALPAGILTDVLDDATFGALRPTVITDIKRAAVVVDHAGAVIELAFDQGEVMAGDAREPIREIELELLGGPPRALFDLALKLHAAAPLRIGRANKAERGFRLLRGEPPVPRKWTGSAVAHGMTAAAAFQSIARGCVDHLAVNEECLLATGDAEAVHQSRVALRRLRSAISLFGDLLAGPETDAIKQDLRWLLQQLGPARDTDVFLSEIIDPVVEAFSSEPALAALHRAYAAEKEEHYRTAYAALQAPRFTALLLELGRWIEGGAWLDGLEDAASPLAQPIESLAAGLLDRRDRKLRKAGRKKLTRLAAEQRHAVRILGKKLRYALEFFAPLYPDKRCRKWLEALAGLQERLGVLNDIAVAEQRLNARLESGDARNGWAAGLVVGWHSAQARTLLKQADREWRRWRAMDRPWQSG